MCRMWSGFLKLCFLSEWTRQKQEGQFINFLLSCNICFPAPGWKLTICCLHVSSETPLVERGARIKNWKLDVIVQACNTRTPRWVISYGKPALLRPCLKTERNLLLGGPSDERCMPIGIDKTCPEPTGIWLNLQCAETQFSPHHSANVVLGGAGSCANLPKGVLKTLEKWKPVLSVCLTGISHKRY